MGKVLAFVLGLLVLAGAAYWALRGARPAPVSAQAIDPSGKPSPNEPGQAKARLDNVREAAKRIEADGQRRANEAAAAPE